MTSKKYFEKERVIISCGWELSVTVKPHSSHSLDAESSAIHTQCLLLLTKYCKISHLRKQILINTTGAWYDGQTYGLCKYSKTSFFYAPGFCFTQFYVLFVWFWPNAYNNNVKF
jgi:hypothetical protein